MKKYSDKVKGTMIKKLVTRPGLSANALAQETGIAQQTLSRWLRESAIIDKKQGGPMEAKRPKDWTAMEKFNAVLDYVKLNPAEQGAFLRTRGLHSVQIDMWKQEMLSILESSPKRKAKKDNRDIRIKELEKELNKKDKALAEAAALLILKKKAQAIWGEPEDD
jgi:transposase